MICKPQNFVQGRSNQRHIKICKGIAAPEIIQPAGKLSQQPHNGAGIHVVEISNITQADRKVYNERFGIFDVAYKNFQSRVRAGRNPDKRSADRQVQSQRSFQISGDEGCRIAG